MTNVMTRLAVALAVIPLLQASTPQVASSQVVFQRQRQPEHKSFLKRHPYLSAAGVGIFTGGIGGILLGTGAAAGAASGAATHTGFHFFHNKWREAHGEPTD